MSLARDRRLSARRAVRFRHVESFALTSFHEFGLAEPKARAPTKPLDITWAPSVGDAGGRWRYSHAERSRGRRVLAPCLALIRSPLASGDGEHTGLVRAGGMSTPAALVGRAASSDGVTTPCRLRVHHPMSIVFDPTRH